MSLVSDIGWTDSSWNPVSGCTEVSPGCAHCYAKVFAERYRGVAGHYYEHGFEVQLRPQQLEKPLHWKPVKLPDGTTRPRRVFVNSMSDLFHEAIPDEYIAECFGVMAISPHTYQILTKRIERAEEFLSDPLNQNWWRNKGASRLKNVFERQEFLQDYFRGPLPNVILGPTVENQHWADVRLPVLARIHTLGWRTMVSYEPALGPVDFENYMEAIGWLIVGGESGAKRRPFDLAWAYSALQQAREAEVPFYFKQGSAFRSESLADVPADLIVREFPS